MHSLTLNISYHSFIVSKRINAANPVSTPGASGPCLFFKDMVISLSSKEPPHEIAVAYVHKLVFDLRLIERAGLPTP